jgi:hypothetical protein
MSSSTKDFGGQMLPKSRFVEKNSRGIKGKINAEVVFSNFFKFNENLPNNQNQQSQK